MRRAWLISIAISFTAHAALVVVGMHAFVAPPRVHLPQGQAATPSMHINLIADPLLDEIVPNPQLVFPNPQSTIRNPQSAIGTPQSPIRNPQSAIRNPQPAGVTADARPVARRNEPPPYPGVARRMGWQGTVFLDVKVRADGTVSAITIAHSSGHPVLDRAALRAVREWRFDPALLLGAPVATSVRLPIRFQLTPD